MIFDISQTLFAKIIGTSQQYISQLADYGTIYKNENGSIWLFYSLRRYFNYYAYSFGSKGRIKEINNAARRVYKIKPRRRRKNINAINSCRDFIPALQIADFKVSVLRNLMKLGGTNPNYLLKAEKEFEHLRDQFNLEKSALTQKILAANIKPVQCETILLARYVDCDFFADIAEDFKLSLSHIYRLHRQGVNQFSKFAQI